MSEVRQRWRLVFGRNDDARFLSHLDAVHLWERAFRRGDVPVATSGGFTPRPRLIFAAPLPLGMLAEHDLADLYLSERLTRAELRARLTVGMPRGYELVDLRDEWVGAPALATRLVAADYRMTLIGAAAQQLDEAVVRLLAADRLPRARRRDKRASTYDLRPLLCDLARRGPAELDAGDATGQVVWMRLRNSQELGIGRAEEVVAALAGELGMGVEAPPDEHPVPAHSPDSDRVPNELTGAPTRALLNMIRPVRERLWLSDELGSSPAKRQRQVTPRRAFGPPIRPSSLTTRLARAR